MRSNSDFRSDINALRAFSVSAVVLFHFSVPGFEGGFAGVDVFFVISGYLMTKIIMSALLKRNAKVFSLGAFYASRAKRILPALFFMLVVLLLLGWFFLTGLDYERLAAHSGHAAIFLSNLKFWREAGYFDVESHDKWLLHTWSLSVEWQFYIVLPLILLLLVKFLRSESRVFFAYVCLCVMGFGVSVWLSINDPDAAFYSLRSRAWEMLAGGVVYFLESRVSFNERSRMFVSLLGHAVIFLAFAILDGKSSWPGVPALLPVMGSALIILAKWEVLYSGRLSFLQWLGLRSYSVYLWHWPVVVAVVYMGVEWAAFSWFLGVCVALLLGGGSYFYIERSAQSLLAKVRPVALAGMVVATVIFVISVAYLIRIESGFPERMPVNVRVLESEANNINPRRAECLGGTENPFPACRYGGEGNDVVLLGDSHASSLATALQAALPDDHSGLLTYMYRACPTMRNVQMMEAKNKGCPTFNDWAFAQVHALPNDIPVVIVNRLSRHLVGEGEDGLPSIYFGDRISEVDDEFLVAVERSLLASYCELSTRRMVYVVKPLPEMPYDVPRYMSRAAMSGRDARVGITISSYLERHNFVLRVLDKAVQKCGIRLLDPLPYLCKSETCLGDSDGRPRYFDDNHLSEFGNKLLIPMFKQVFEH